MQHDYRPQPKVVAAAVATLLVWVAAELGGMSVPPGVEGAVAVVVAYLVPSTASRPLDDV